MKLGFFLWGGIIFSLLFFGGTYIYFKVDNLEVTGKTFSLCDSTNVLRVCIKFSVTKPASFFVRYWPINNREQYQDTSPTEKGLEHAITLLGLRENTTYEYQVLKISTWISSETKIDNFSTLDAPRAMLRSQWIQKPGENFPGYILSQRSRLKSREGFIYFLDFGGNLVWYQRFPLLPKVSLLSNRKTVLVIAGEPTSERSAGDRIYEFDLSGRELLNVDLRSLSEPIEVHHDIQYDSKGNLVGLIYDKRKFILPTGNQNNESEIKGDAIVRFDRTGNIKWKWSVYDIETPGKSEYPYDSLGEWGHANTLTVDKDGHYLISFRDWNQIWKINAENGKVMWKLGKGGNLKLPEGFEFSGQHSIHINPKGEYMMFDNGVEKKISRVLCFTIDESNSSVTEKLLLTLPNELYCEKRGSAYYVNDSTILICLADIGQLVLMNEHGEILGRAHTGLPDYYRAMYLPDFK